MSARPHRVKVLRYDPRMRAVMTVLAVVCVVTAVVVAFVLGQARGNAANAEVVSNHKETEAELEASRASAAALSQQVVNLSKGVDIDRVAAAEVRTAVAEARAQIARLEQEVAIYKSLMDSTVRTKGLALQSFDVGATDQPGKYRLRLTFLQRAQRHVQLKGSVRVSISGLKAGAPLTLSHQQLFGGSKSAAMELDFLYFQIHEEDFSLPPGFEPKQVRIQASAAGRKPQQLDETRGWLAKGE